MTDSNVTAEPQLRLAHVFAIGAGAMFSSGFFLLPGIAAAETGPSLPLAYLLAGVLVLPTMLSVTELATAMPRAGGPYHFYRRALGPTAATVGGIGLWVALVLKSAFALVGIDAYLTLMVALPAGSVGLVLAAVFTALNLVGARESAVIQVALVAVLLVVLAGFVVVGGITTLPLDDERLAERFSPLFAGGALGLLAATAIVFVAFAGLPQVASVAGEIRDPARTIPRGVLAALGTATAVYVAGTAVLVVALPPDELRGDPTPIASAAETFGVGLAVPLVVVAALAAFASTGNAGIMSASRYPLALARDGIVWGRFGRMNDSGVPVASVVLTGVTIAAVVTVFDVEGIAKLGSTFVLISFGMMNASVIVLRRSHVPDYRPSFRVPWSPWLPGFGVLTSVVLVIDLGGIALASTLALLVGGIAWHRWVRRGRQDASGAIAAGRRRRRLLRRARADGTDLEQLFDQQEIWPSADDHAPEILDGLVARRVASGGPAAIRAAAATALAEVVAVAPDEARAWLRDERHHRLRLDDDAEVHLIGLDAAAAPVVVIAWTPEGPSDREVDGADRSADGDEGAGAGTELRGTTVVVVASGGADRARAERIVALLASQLGTRSLRESWPVDPDAVSALLASDASQRQGAEPPRPRRPRS